MAQFSSWISWKLSCVCGSCTSLSCAAMPELQQHAVWLGTEHPVQVLAGSQYLLYIWHQLYKTVCKTVKVSWYPPRHRLILFLCMSPLYGFFHFPFAPASFPGHVGETAWQLPWVQTVYGCNVTAMSYLIQAVKSMWYFHQMRMVLSCSWKQLFAAGSVTEGKQKMNKQKKLRRERPHLLFELAYM